MGLLLTATTGLVIWIVLWALGLKAIDGFFVVLTLVIFAVVARVLGPHLPSRRGSDTGPGIGPG